MQKGSERGSGKCAASCGNEWIPNIVVVMNRIRAGELHSTGVNGKCVFQYQVHRHGLVNWSAHLDVRILKHAPHCEWTPVRILRNTQRETYV